MFSDDKSAISLTRDEPRNPFGYYIDWAKSGANGPLINYIMNSVKGNKTAKQALIGKIGREQWDYAKKPDFNSSMEATSGQAMAGTANVLGDNTD